MARSPGALPGEARWSQERTSIEGGEDAAPPLLPVRVAARGPGSRPAARSGSEYPTQMWTLARVAEVTEQVTGVADSQTQTLDRAARSEAALVFQIKPGSYSTDTLIEFLTDPHQHFGDHKVVFPPWLHHAVFADSPLPTLAAEADSHAIIEQVHADLKNGPLAHLPSASLAANSAWFVLAAMVFNPTRAADVLASAFHAKATTATIRRQLIAVAADQQIRPPINIATAHEGRNEANQRGPIA